MVFLIRPNPNLFKEVNNLIAYDIAVQPMTDATGLIFAMRSRYTSQTKCC